MGNNVSKIRGSMKKATYIIVAWNNKDILDDCIGSINQQDYPTREIILVDNASKDNTVDYVREKYPNVTVLPQDANYGFAKGNNIGIRKALEDPDCEYVVLLNSDARIKENWTSTLVNEAAKRPKAAMLQSITLDFYDPGIIDSTHVYISRIGQGTQGSWRHPIPFGYDVAPQKVFGCNAAAMMITRKFIEAQPFRDFFDETMFMYLEDVDVAARATVMGWDNFVIPGTRAYHMGSFSSAKKDPSYSLYMTFRNNTGLLIKNLPTKIIWLLLFKIIKADRAAIKHLKRIDKGYSAPAVVKGRLVSILYIPIFIIKRHKLKKYRKVNSEYLWNLMRLGF